MNVTAEDLQALLTRPIAFHKLLAIAGGSMGAGVFLSQLVYWSERTKDPEGWVYKTLEDWWEETAMSRFELETVRGALKKRQLLEEKHAGVPAKLYYRIDWDHLRTALPEAARKHREGLRKRDTKFPTEVPPKGSRADATKTAELTQTEGVNPTVKTAEVTQTVVIGGHAIKDAEVPQSGTYEDKSSEVTRATLLEQRLPTESTTTTPAEGAPPPKEAVVVVSSGSGSYEAQAESEAETLEDLETDFGLNPEQAGKLRVYHKRRGIAYVEEKAELTRAEPRKNAAAFFMLALEKNWKAPVKLDKKVKPAKPEPPKEKAPVRPDYSAQWELWQRASDEQREAWRQDHIIRQTEPKPGEKPRTAFLARLHGLTQPEGAAAA